MPLSSRSLMAGVRRPPVRDKAGKRDRRCEMGIFEDLRNCGSNFCCRVLYPMCMHPRYTYAVVVGERNTLHWVGTRSVLVNLP